MFAHLHLHTEYSLLDGACRIGPLIERLKALGMTSCAVTDHGVMYGVVDFYRAAKEAGLTEVPAVIIEADDRKVMELGLIENLQREDLNPLEEARGYESLAREVLSRNRKR